MPTRQLTRCCTQAPTGAIHRASLEIHGNDVSGTTDCGKVINPKTWKRVTMLFAIFTREVKCRVCFP